MAAPAGVIWWCACVRYWPYRGVSTCASVLKLVLTKGFFERWTSTGSELLAIYDTGKPPVSNRSKCEDLVVAHGRFDCIVNTVLQEKVKGAQCFEPVKSSFRVIFCSRPNFLKKLPRKRLLRRF